MGCSPSKTSGVQVTQPTSQAHLLDNNHANNKADKAGMASVQASHHLKVSILGASGLRILDSATGKSDIIVSAEIAGKADFKISSPVISGVASNLNGSGRVDVIFTFEGELKGWVAGDKIVFTVTDSAQGALLLGRASVAPTPEQGTFEGEVVLEEAGEGYRPVLQVKVLREQLLVETVHEVTDAISATVATLSAAAAHLAEVEGPRIQEVEAVCATITDDVQAALGDVTAATDDVVGAVKLVTHEVKQSLEEAYGEVEETKGHVCCWC